MCSAPPRKKERKKKKKEKKEEKKLRTDIHLDVLKLLILLGQEQEST